MLNFLLGRRQPAGTVREVLEGLGVSADEIDRAEADGTAELMAIDRIALPEPPLYTIEEVADEVGADQELVRALWRALGFAVVEDERAFSKRDVEIMSALAVLMRDGATDPDVTLQMSRALGLSMARFATAVVDATEARSEERREVVAAGDEEALARHDAESLAVRAGELLPFLSEVMDYAFRRHLRAATRRRMMLATKLDGQGEVVGFADLARYTKLSQALDERELARLVTRFDQLTNDVVVSHGGRIVKMIGDEAMFTVVEPVAAARIGLELCRVVGADAELSDVRVGLASGPVLARDGDLYGPAVNIASRLVELGPPGSVMVSQEIRDSVVNEPWVRARSVGVRRLRHIGNVRVYRLRPDTARASST